MENSKKENWYTVYINPKELCPKTLEGKTCMKVSNSSLRVILMLTFYVIGDSKSPSSLVFTINGAIVS